MHKTSGCATCKKVYNYHLIVEEILWVFKNIFTMNLRNYVTADSSDRGRFAIKIHIAPLNWILRGLKTENVDAQYHVSFLIWLIRKIPRHMIFRQNMIPNPYIFMDQYLILCNLATKVAFYMGNVSLFINKISSMLGRHDLWYTVHLPVRH